VLEAFAFGGGRGAGEDLQPRVELERVGGDGDGVLPIGSQALGERDRDLRLADAGRSEQGDDRQGPHGGQDRRPARPEG
jgi:hypothetical protein